MVAELMTGLEMCFQVLYLDQVKVIFIRESGVHLTVQLLEIILDGVRGQCVIVIFTEVMVACDIRE